MAEWISVNKRKPRRGKVVMVYAPNCNVIGSILTGVYFPKERGHKSSWTVYDFGGSNLGEFVTHWMPLPKKPN